MSLTGKGGADSPSEIASPQSASPQSASPRPQLDLRNAFEDVAPLAPVALRVIELANDPDASAADLARAVSRDQGLTARVLRTCNSSYYGLIQPVSSLSQAVVLMGVRAVRSMVLLHSLPMCHSGGAWGEVERQLWKHAVGSALASRLLGLRTGRLDPEMVFLAGLFHDLGRILIFQVRPLVYQRLCQKSPGGKPECEVERQIFGLDHAEAGAGVLTRWRMGEELAAAARDHHGEVSLMSPVVLHVCAAEVFLEDPEAEPCASPRAALRMLGLDEGLIEELRPRLNASLQQERGL